MTIDLHQQLLQRFPFAKYMVRHPPAMLMRTRLLFDNNAIRRNVIEELEGRLAEELASRNEGEMRRARVRPSECERPNIAKGGRVDRALGDVGRILRRDPSEVAALPIDNDLKPSVLPKGLPPILHLHKSLQ